MKFTITYELDPQTPESPYWAKTPGYVACGHSFEEARERLIMKLKLANSIHNIPPAETVEI